MLLNFKLLCVIPLLAPALGQARTTIGYLVYNFKHPFLVYKIPYRRARAWPRPSAFRPSASRKQRYLAYKSFPFVTRTCENQKSEWNTKGSFTNYVRNFCRIFTPPPLCSKLFAFLTPSPQTVNVRIR